MGALDTKQWGVVSTDGSEGDKGEALQKSRKFTGDPEQDMKFEGEHPNSNVSAAQMNNSGRE